MTVNTPFARRPATPWVVSSRPTPLASLRDFDISQIVDPITGVFRTIQQGEPGMYTHTDAYGNTTTYRQPIGSESSLPVGNVSGNFGTSVQGGLNLGSGVWILLAIGVGLVLFSGRGGGRR